MKWVIKDGMHLLWTKDIIDAAVTPCFNRVIYRHSLLWLQKMSQRIDLILKYLVIYLSLKLSKSSKPRAILKL